MAGRKDNNSGILIIALLLLIAAVAAYIFYEQSKPDPAKPNNPAGPGESHVVDSAALEASASVSATPTATPDEAAAASAAAAGFSYLPNAEYRPAVWAGKATGKGYGDFRNWSDEMCFPLADAGYANSQVYGPGGGGNGSPVSGGYSQAPNFAYPWADNFCEWRDRATGYCSGGKGHAGQDIRPASNAPDTYWAVAAEDAVFVSYDYVTLQIRGTKAPYRVYNYLHMTPSSIQISAVPGNNTVSKGQKLGKVSNYLKVTGKDGGGNPIFSRATSLHLHFEIKSAQAETLSNGTIIAANKPVSPYSALVLSYQRKLGGIGCN